MTNTSETIQPAIQLYTLRAIDEPLPTIIERVADAGFEGVEFANRVRDADIAAVAAALERTGLEPVGVHIGMDDLTELERDPTDILEQFETIECRTLVLNHPSVSHFRTEDRILELAERMNAVGEMLSDRGFSLGYHHADHDFIPLTNRTPFSRFLVQDVSHRPISSLSIEKQARTVAERVTALAEAVDDQLFHISAEYRSSDPVPLIGGTAFGRLVTATDPEYVWFELDVGNVAAAGYDPVEVLQRIEDRVRLVHLKDVTVDQPIPGTGNRSVDLGTGELDLKLVVKTANQSGAQWLIYEHDDPSDPVATLQDGADMMHSLLEIEA